VKGDGGTLTICEIEIWGANGDIGGLYGAASVFTLLGSTDRVDRGPGGAAQLV
jgi:hypothetical protein